MDMLCCLGLGLFLTSFFLLGQHYWPKLKINLAECEVSYFRKVMCFCSKIMFQTKEG